MSTKEKAVRDAAILLADAITAAQAAGLVVTWPRRAEDLPAIAISETAKAAPMSERLTAGTTPANKIKPKDAQ